MKKVILLIALALTFAVSATAQQAPVDTVVKRLNQSNQIAEKISNDTVTGFERYVQVTNVFWNMRQKQFKIYFQVHNYSGTRAIYSYRVVQTLNNEEQYYPSGDKASPQDSIANEQGALVSKIDSLGTLGQYNLLYQTVSSGQIDIIPLIRAQIAKLDSQNKFYQ